MHSPKEQLHFMAHNQINIDVVYATADKQYTHHLQVMHPCTIEDAIIQSGLLTQCREINLTINKVGIFSKSMPLATLVKEGDRVEIYRPLIIDPKQARIQKVVRKEKISRARKRRLRMESTPKAE